MKKFVFLYCGMPDPSPTTKATWQAWFAELGDSLLDGGNPLGVGRWVTPAGSSDISESDPAKGYSLVSAESLEAAEAIAATCPAATGVRVYEALPM